MDKFQVVIVVDEKVNFNLNNALKRMALGHNDNIYVKMPMKLQVLMIEKSDEGHY